MRMLDVTETDIIGDLGCGAGYFTFEIAKKGRVAIGVDWKLNAKLSFVMQKHPNVFYVKGDVQRLPFSSDTFSKILVSSVLQLVEDDRVLVRECNRILKQAGDLVLSVPTEYLWIQKLNEIKDRLNVQFESQGPGYYALNDLRELLQNGGFKIVEMEYSPKEIYSLIYELLLFLCYRLGLPLSSPIYFFILYPFAILDKLPISKKRKGNEVLIKAIKTRRQTI